MSKRVTDYLLDQIAEKEATIDRMMREALASHEYHREQLAVAWDAGFDALRDEMARQKRDSDYPIHRRNPHQEGTS